MSFQELVPDESTWAVAAGLSGGATATATAHHQAGSQAPNSSDGSTEPAASSCRTRPIMPALEGPL